MQLNASRIKVLQAQDDVVNSMKEAAAKELLKVSSERNVYRKLLNDLVVQVAKMDSIPCCHTYVCFSLYIGMYLKVMVNLLSYFK